MKHAKHEQTYGANTHTKYIPLMKEYRLAIANWKYMTADSTDGLSSSVKTVK